MNKLTAYRTFAKPGYTPVKHVRIYKDKWYLCTFQNVEHDARIDYIGLADGEYVELLPGDKARQARDAHLNHLNAIREYTGEVWSVQWHNREPEYVTSKTNADALSNKYHCQDALDLEKARKEVQKQLARSDADVLAKYGKCKDWPGNEVIRLQEWRKSYQSDLERCEVYYNEEIKVTRIR